MKARKPMAEVDESKMPVKFKKDLVDEKTTDLHWQGIAQKLKELKSANNKK